MRYVFFVLSCVMLLFMAVQFNDPDGFIWMCFYGVPAMWCALAFYKLNVFSYLWVRVALIGSIAASMVGVVYFWPLTPQFWSKQVWINEETAREGMGMMIVAIVLISVLLFANRRLTPN